MYWRDRRTGQEEKEEIFYLPYTQFSKQSPRATMSPCAGKWL